ncbi:hypothetical protein G3I62_27225 [Streptomyces sp. SID14446]|uniref:DUF7848 domain-containing protein n=1 Tax=Streptomyces sp. SID14446 TaxID=2706072 RepID=UPI0013BBDF25|nr:hypothetical protein [Streptomyces sp. SID14446]NEB32741.1 hypothetical protein [Streptomyces sp. SID14446]
MTLPELVDGALRLELGPSPVQEWFECASCVELIDLRVNDDREGWATEHAKTNPGHTRFRTVRQQEYRVVPDTP